MELLRDLARHQAWADAQHWSIIRANPALLEDAELVKRLNHMTTAGEWLRRIAGGETPDFAALKAERPAAEIEEAMTKANQDLLRAIEELDLKRMITLPRGPKGPFEAPAEALLVQLVTHTQHHRAQNGSRMRALGVTPPMTDYIFWYAQGRP